MTKITGIELVGNVLPIAGKTYGVGRITAVEGDIPPEFDALRYTDEKMEKVFPLNNDNVMSNIGAIYVFVEVIESGEESVELKIIENHDEFLSPFDFPDDTRKTFGDHYLSKRLADAAVADFEMEVQDEGTESGTSVCMAFYNIAEISYIDSGIASGKLIEFFTPEQLSNIQSHPVRMVFAEALTKAVDVYNQINFYDMAPVFAEQITKITAINQNGDKTALTMSAVENLFTMIKDNLRIK